MKIISAWIWVWFGILFPAQIFCEETQTLYQFSEESQIGFEAQSTLHPFAGQTRRLQGNFAVDWSSIERSRGGRLEIEAPSLETGNRLRDKKMKAELLAVDEFPSIVFESRSCAGKISQDPRAPSSLALKGVLILHGVSREIAVPLEVDRTNPGRLILRGKVPLRLTEYNIPVPSVFGVIKMEDKVEVWFRLVATAQS